MHSRLGISLHLGGGKLSMDWDYGFLGLKPCRRTGGKFRCGHIWGLVGLFELGNLLLKVSEVFDAEDDFACFSRGGGGVHDEEGGASGFELLGEL